MTLRRVSIGELITRRHLNTFQRVNWLMQYAKPFPNFFLKEKSRT